MKRIPTLFIAVTTVSVALVACDRNRSDTGKTAPEVETHALSKTNEPSTNEATAASGKNSEAIAKITSARCEREQRCGNVGPDKDYTSTAACQTDIQKEWRDDLNARECPGGIVEKELAECLEEIRNEDCASPFDTLGRVTACRSSDICKAMVN